MRKTGSWHLNLSNKILHLFCYLKKGNGIFLGHCINKREGRTWLSPFVRFWKINFGTGKGKDSFSFCQTTFCRYHWRASLAKCANRFEQLWHIKDLCKVMFLTKIYKHLFSCLSSYAEAHAFSTDIFSSVPGEICSTFLVYNPCSFQE